MAPPPSADPCGIEIRRRQDAPCGSEHTPRERKMREQYGALLKERRGSIGRDLYYEVRQWCWISRAREMKEAREKGDDGRWHTREREWRTRKRHGRQLICIYIHPRGNSVQLLTLMYTYPFIPFLTSIPPLRRSYLDDRPQIRSDARMISYQVGKLLGRKNVILEMRKIVNRF